jgi:ParB family chromosome partitioning protein
MGRKNLLSDLLPAPEEEPATPEQALRPFPRRVGVVGAMSETFDAMAANLREANEKIEKIDGGALVVEIDVDLIEPSFIKDRIGDNDNIDELIASIRDYGQDTPILLRPHPEKEGRYQIACGHRRHRAIKTLGRPIKAFIKPLTDAELVIAQGRENGTRLNLSYIERAKFAAHLEQLNFDRHVICSALNIDRAEVSRMIAVAAGLPDELLETIGAARKTGRRRWMQLRKAMDGINWESEGDNILKTCREHTSVDSDVRLMVVIRDLTRMTTKQTTTKESKPEPDFKVQKKPGVIRISFDETTLPAETVTEFLSRVREVCSSFGVKS